MPVINGELVNTDCSYFRGDVPCQPNKQEGYHCAGCPVYTPIQKRILIIKLGAIGDVIRTTPLIRKIRQEYPQAKITWLTHTPAILPKHAVDEILKFDLPALIYLQHTSFDLLYNLDKDKEACALHDSVRANEKYGYTLEHGVAFPANHLANHKYLTGIFDDISLKNTKSYVEEIFEICGWEFNGEDYIFDNHEDKDYEWPFDHQKPLVGLNTGCGDRWTTRLWSEQKWLALIKLLQEQNFQVVLLGGEQEHARNQSLSSQTDATYLGYFKLEQFINLMHQMDVIVTQVTMAMHIAIALGKKMVLMNNIFNPHEFELYGRGYIVQPDKACNCFYRGACKFGVSCMEDLPAEKVFQYVAACLNSAKAPGPVAG